MKFVTPLLCFLLFSVFSFGQSKIDSLRSAMGSVQIPKAELPQMPDSLKTAWTKVDSIRNNFNASADSINNRYQSEIAGINKLSQELNHQLDSLNTFQLPANKLTARIDSLNNERTALETKANSKLDSLKAKTIGQLNRIELTPEMQGPVGEFTQKINGFNISGEGLTQLPPLKIEGFQMPDIKNISGGTLPELSSLTKIETPLGDVSQITDQVQGYGADIKNITEGNLNDLEQIPQTIEQQATKFDGISELQEASGTIGEYESQLESLQDPAAMAGKAKEVVVKKAINHFAGKEEVLKKAMEEMSKYKRKYASVPSIKDLPKRPPNAMKGKPFVERLMPGMFLQFQVRGAWLLDVNPYVGYHISGRFTAGLGWNQRLAYWNKLRFWDPTSRIYGPRAFFDAKIGRGYIVHLETEAMNTFVPYQQVHQDDGSRQWAWSTMLGLKKQYKISRRLNGTVLIQYNLTNQYLKTPYFDRLNSRMGFEYVLRKRSKKSKESKD